MLPDKFDELHDKYLEAWMRAEEILKKTERIQNEVFIPSIMELRYAARRVVDANILFNKGDASDSEIEVHLIEASENCRKATHDAVDALVNFIHEELLQYEKKVGPSMLSRAFSNYTKLTGKMTQVDQCIIKSRKDRTVLDEEYKAIADEHLPALVDLYFEMRSSQKITKHLQRADRKNIIIGSIVIGTLAALTLMFLDKNGYLDWMIMDNAEVAAEEQQPKSAESK